MAKRGRPTVYRAEFAEQARKYCLLGATDADLARMFEVAESTINKWKLDHPEFSESIKAGKDDADANVARSLYHRAIGYNHKAVKIFCNAGEVTEAPYVERYPPDTAAAIFWLKNRRGGQWRDKQDLEHTGEVTHEHKGEITWGGVRVPL